MVTIKFKRITLVYQITETVERTVGPKNGLFERFIMLLNLTSNKNDYDVSDFTLGYR